MRTALLLAAACAIAAPAVASAHDMRGEGAPPPLAGAPQPGGSWGEPGPRGYAPPASGPMHGPMRGADARAYGEDRYGPPPPCALAPPPSAWAPPHRMGPPPMRMAGAPCGLCTTLRPVRLHDGWLSWHGKTYF